MRIHVAVSIILLVVAAGSALADSLPFEDEELLALEVSGQLLPPPALVAQIGQDLTAIRATYPEISDIHTFPNWIPGELLVGLTNEGWAAYLDGTFTELDALNAQYGAINIHPYFSLHLLFIQFDSLYHPQALGEIYRGLEGVSYTDPNVVGGDGSDIWCDEPSVYTFKRGWGDCLSGCIYNDFWVFSVDGESVDLIGRWGSSVSGVGPDPVGQTALLQGIAPNPFNPSTTIRYRLDQADWVRLTVYDLRGRPIAELVNEYRFPGEHQVVWRGVDGSGAPAASGVYFCRMVAGGVVQIQEMTLLK